MDSTIVDAGADQEAAVAAAADALRDGRLAVLPTDTVYGVAADAFQPVATRRVFGAKRRSRQFPLPVLVRSPKQLLGLCSRLPEAAERLMAAYWPGPLTLVVASEPTLTWDLGAARGTVAVRMPLDDVTLAVIREVGPLAVTSANLSGHAPATTAAMAQRSLGEQVAVYVDAGARRDTRPSTIVDLTRAEVTVLRAGPVAEADVLAVADGSLDPLEAAGRLMDAAGEGNDAVDGEDLAPDAGTTTPAAPTSDDRDAVAGGDAGRDEAATS